MDNSPLLSTTYCLPRDLKLYHYSDYQTHITSAELIKTTNEKIAKVQRFIRDFNDSHGGGQILNDMSMFIDEDGNYIEFIETDHLTSHLTTQSQHTTSLDGDQQLDDLTREFASLSLDNKTKLS
eukprot:UN08237